MHLELKEIKLIRKKSGLTQSQLARLAGVSQSLIAKVESGRIDPAYSKALKVFEALDRLNNKNEAKAGDIMNRRIISTSPHEDIRKVIKIMKRHAISQIPIIEEQKLVGLVSESIILNSLVNRKGKYAKEIMEDSPPVISTKTRVNIVSNLIRHFPIVMVANNGKLVGVITKSDLIRQLYSKD